MITFNIVTKEEYMRMRQFMHHDVNKYHIFSSFSLLCCKVFPVNFHWYLYSVSHCVLATHPQLQLVTHVSLCTTTMNTTNCLFADYY